MQQQQLLYKCTMTNSPWSKKQSKKWPLLLNLTTQIPKASARRTTKGSRNICKSTLRSKAPQITFWMLVWTFIPKRAFSKRRRWLVLICLRIQLLDQVALSKSSLNNQTGSICKIHHRLTLFSRMKSESRPNMTLIWPNFNRISLSTWISRPHLFLLSSQLKTLSKKPRSYKVGFLLLRRRLRDLRLRFCILRVQILHSHRPDTEELWVQKLTIQKITFPPMHRFLKK